MLYKYRYKNKKAFKNCKESIECVEYSGGGKNKQFLNKHFDNFFNNIMD